MTYLSPEAETVTKARSGGATALDPSSGRDGTRPSGPGLLAPGKAGRPPPRNSGGRPASVTVRIPPDPLGGRRNPTDRQGYRESPSGGVVCQDRLRLTWGPGGEGDQPHPGGSEDAASATVTRARTGNHRHLSVTQRPIWASRCAPRSAPRWAPRWARVAARGSGPRTHFLPSATSALPSQREGVSSCIVKTACTAKTAGSW